MSAGSRRWRLAAACADTAERDWFPAPQTAIDPELLTLCRACPVWRDCLLFALARPEIRDGIWAGLTAREMARLRDRLRRGELGADLLQAAHEIAHQRGPVTIYTPRLPKRLPNADTLTAKREQVEAQLRMAGLLDDNQRRGRAA